MKKTLSLMLVGTLLAPSLLFAQDTATTEGRPIPPRDLVRERMDTRMENRASSTLPKKENVRPVATRASSSNPSSLGFCQNIDKALSQLDTKKIKLEDKREKLEEKKDEKRAEVRSNVDEKRDENEAKRKAQFEELTKRATNDEQKQAIIAFQTAMDQALATKKEAIDAILAAHRSEVDKAVDSRKADMEKAITALKSSIESAKIKAKSDCTSGVNGDQVRKDLRTSIEKAQSDFRATVKNIEKIKDVSSASKTTKKEEIKKIEEAYKTSLAKAKSDLKAALKTQKTSTSTTQ